MPWNHQTKTARNRFDINQMSFLNTTNVISNLISIADVCVRASELVHAKHGFCLIIDKIYFSFAVAAAVADCRQFQSKHFIRRARKTQSESEQ